MSRVRICFVVNCGFFISQMLKNEFWTCYMADDIQQAFWGPFGIDLYSFSPFSFKLPGKITAIWQCKILWPNATASVPGKGWRENCCIPWYKGALNISASAYLVSLVNYRL